MNLSARSRARRLQRLLALLGAVILLVGLAPPASAAGARVDPSSYDRSRLEPALANALTSRPDEKFKVIVTRQPARDKSERRARESEMENDLKSGGGRVGRRLGLVEGHAASLDAKAIAKLSRDTRVKSISFDHKVELHQVTTAPLGGVVGAVAGTLLQSTNVQEANAPQVWSQGNTGQGVAVAVLDSGIAASPDLPNAIFGVDVVTHRTTLGDKGGHGSHVAGIIAGNGTLSAGAYKGVAPGAKVVSVKVTDDKGNASYSSVIAGIGWILANQKAYNIKVANLSLGAVPQSGYADDPLDAAVEALWFRGITVVASAGNNGPTAGTIGVPGNDPYVITVGAVDDNGTAGLGDDLLPSWSSRGPTAYDGFNKPDLTASGRKVVSLRAVGSTLDVLYGVERLVATKYFRLSGTSMSTPLVSGVAALMLAANPSLTPNQIKAILARTARPVAGGDRNAVGAGAVDAAAAVQLARSPSWLRANTGLTPSRALIKMLWPMLKQSKPIWRHTGYWMGRTWTNGSWDNGSWDNGSWDNGSWDNGSWDNGSWDALVWSNLDWESTTWDNGSWDDSGWDDSGWDDSGWDNGSWDNGSWDSAPIS